MRKLTRLFPYLALLLLPVIALLVILRAGPLDEHVRRGIEGEFSRQLDREVTIGGASVALSGRLALSDLGVWDQDGSALLTAPEVTARLGGSWLRLLSGAPEVRQVKLIRPELTLTRDADGRLSVSDLLDRQAKEPSRFRGELVVEGGRLVFVDGGRGGIATVIEGADLRLRWPNPGRATFSLKARGADGAIGDVDLKGESDAESGLTRLWGSVSDLDVPSALARLPATRALGVARGRTDVEGEVVLGRQGPGGTNINYDVTLNVRGGEVSFPWLRRPVTQVSGQVHFVDSDVRLVDVSGAVAGAPMHTRGIIEDLGSPALDLDVSVAGITYPQIQTLFPEVALPPGLAVPGSLQITARVEGPASDVRVTGEGTVRVIEYRSVPWNDLMGRFEYSSGRLKLTGLRAHGSPRRAEAEGTVEWGKGGTTFEGAIDLTDVPLSLLAQMVGMDGTDVQGTGSVKMHAESDEGVSISGDFDLRDAVVRGVPVGRVSGEFEIAGESIRLERCAFDGPMGSGSLSAKMSLDGAFDGEALFSALDLSTICGVIGVEGMRGMVGGEIKASGDRRTLTGTGWVELGPCEVAGRALGGLRARIDVSPLRLQVSDLLVLLGEGEYRSESLAVTNWLAGWRRAQISGRLAIAGAQLGEWVAPEYADAVPEGRVDGEIELSGTPVDPRLRLKLTLKSLRVAGRPIESGQLVARYERGRLSIEEMFLSDRGTRLVVTGGYDPQAGLNLGVAADPLNLSWIAPAARRRYGVTLAGEITAVAKVTGPLEDPQIEFRAESGSLGVNDEDIEEFVVSGRFAEGVVWVEEGVVRLEAGTISFSGEADLRARTADITLTLADVELGRLYAAGYLAIWRLHQAGDTSPWLAAYAKVPHPLSGLLTADVRVEGPFGEPQIKASRLIFEGLGYAGRKIGRIEGDVAVRPRLDGSGFSVREAMVNLLASDEMGDAQISGGVTPEGEISLVVDSLGHLDLSLLGPWLRYPLDLNGQATINFDVTGPIHRPILRGDVWVDQLRLGPFEAEQAMASPISVQQGVLKVEEIRFSNPPQAGGPRMEATGSAALPLYPADGPSGAERATAPRAELHVRNGSVTLVPGMEPAFFDADVHLEGRRIVFEDRDNSESDEPRPGVRVRMGSGALEIGGAVALGRPAPADWRENEFDVTFELDSAELMVPGLASMKFDGALWLTNVEASATERAQRAAWSMLGETVGVLQPSMFVMAREMREQLYGNRAALLKTHEGDPVVVSELTVVVPKLGSLMGPDRVVLGPKVEIEVLVGEAEQGGQGPDGDRELPTDVVVDLGLLEVSGPASGRLQLGGELSAESYELNGAVEAVDARVAFPNAVLTLRRGTVEVRRERGRELEVMITNAEAVGRVGDYHITLRPAGRVYPMEETGVGEGEDAERLPPMPLHATTIPYLDPAIAVALLWGPVVTPTRGGGMSSEGLIQEPAAGGRGTGEITGMMLPTLGGGSGAPGLSLDVSLQGPVRMKLGERLFSRVLVTYSSPVSGPEGTRSLGVTYEVISPLLSIGWSVDERDRTRWEVRGFRSF